MTPLAALIPWSLLTTQSIHTGPPPPPIYLPCKTCFQPGFQPGREQRRAVAVDFNSRLDRKGDRYGRPSRQ